jgi:RNA polymerase sigma factor (sigma-70 family)
MHLPRPFFDRWYPRLVRFLHARTGDADQAEDLAQEVFLRLLKHRPRNPRAWLFRVAVNLLRDEARLARGRSRRLTLLEVERSEEVDLGPEAEVLRSEEVAHVRHALAELPSRDQELLLLHFAGFRYSEIADELNLARGSIGSLLTRAQRRFLKHYESRWLPAARQGESEPLSKRVGGGAFR